MMLIKNKVERYKLNNNIAFEREESGLSAHSATYHEANINKPLLQASLTNMSSSNLNTNQK